MNRKEKRILLALEALDDKYLEQAKPRGRKSRLPLYRSLSVVACLVLAVGAVLLPAIFKGDTQAPMYEQNYEQNPAFIAVMNNYLINSDYSVNINMGDAGSDNENEKPSNPGTPNGNYFEVTDNQVDGIIEGDLVKATEKYLFRLGTHTVYIYSIDGGKSTLVSQYTVPYIDGEGSYISDYDMFLSDDGCTLTLFGDYDGNYDSIPLGKTIVMSIDVSDVTAPKEISRAVINGEKNAVRKIGDSFYLVSNWMFKQNRIDLNDPASFIPSIDYGDKKHICASDKIVFPEEISIVYYTYVIALSERDLALVDEAAIMTSGDVYFTENSIVFDRAYYSEEAVGGKNVKRCYTKVGVLDISNGLAWRGNFTVKGWTNDQYSYDEQNGVLRMVTSTSDKGGIYSTAFENASLYVYDLKTLEKISSVEEFAPQGEGVTAVRFEGDKLYVCTAEITLFTDPVYIFDLSDYNNITYINTGYINGFSTSLIDLGEGYLLGVGVENRSTNKLEVYKRDGDNVVSVDKYLFGGAVCTDYKSFLINREENIFGLSIDGYTNGQSDKKNVYLVLRFDGESLNVICELGNSSDYARAFVNDGFIYLTLPNDLYVSGIDGKFACEINNTHKLGEWTVAREASCGEWALRESICSCGRSITKRDYSKEYSPHDLSNGICVVCGEDIGSAEKNADLIIYTSCGDGTCVVSGTKEIVFGTVVIPTYSPNKEKVVEIGNKAFMNSGVEQIILPNSVKVIDDYAFYQTSLEYIDTKNVVTIGKGAFMLCEDLSGVVFSNSLEMIGIGAFEYCETLKEAIIPDSVTEIGKGAFDSCSSLERVRLPDGLTEISYGLFNLCESLTSVEIPDSVRVIADYGFNFCRNLNYIKIPDGVSSIGFRAFGACQRMAGIELGAGVAEIGDQAFDECTALVEIINRSPLNITIGSEEHGGIALYAKSIKNGGESSLREIDGYTFLLSENKNVLVAYNGNDTVLCLPILPDGAEYEIGNRAFYQEKEITEIHIPYGVTSIGDYAFRECNGLTSMILPDSVKTIGKGAFLGCNFTSFDMGNGVISISEGAFRSCGKLESISMSQRLEIIGADAFSSCYKLVDLKIPATVKEIGEQAFGGCFALTKAVIPNGVTVIEKKVFDNCKSLVSVVIPDSVTEIKDGVFYACPSLKKIYYKGSEDEWNQIKLAYNNGIFEKVTIVFNYDG